MAGFARRRVLNITSAIAAAPLLGTLRPIRVAQSAEGSPVWSIRGLYVEACPCTAICPCEVKGPPTAGYCTVLSGYRIEAGRFGDQALDGLNAVRLLHSPGEMSKGEFRVGFYIDERADARQREALSHIFSFKPGGAFAKIAGVVATDLGVKVARITFEANGNQRKLSVAGIAEADIKAITGLDNKEVVIENTKPFPIVAARSDHASYNDHGIQMDVSGKNGFYSPFAFSSA